MRHATAAALCIALLFPVCPASAKQVRASFYGGGEYLNRRTASGEVFNAHAMTAASYAYPIGARLRVCRNGCVIVRVNDRGPNRRLHRTIDLSRAAAAAIGLIHAGVGIVNIERL